MIMINLTNEDDGGLDEASSGLDEASEFFNRALTIMQERHEKYGDASRGHAQIGYEWTGLLQKAYGEGVTFPYPIPDYVVLSMFAVSKLNRLVEDNCDDDHFLDAVIYTVLAWIAARSSKS